MCANCVAQGAAYVGGAVGALQVMRARARHRRLERQLARAGDEGPTADPSTGPTPVDDRDARDPRATAAPDGAGTGTPARLAP